MARISRLRAPVRVRPFAAVAALVLGGAALAPMAPAPAQAAAGAACTLPDTLKTDATLSPGCVRRGTVRIAKAGVTLDCAGATLDSRGMTGNTITVLASDVTVRNCLLLPGRDHGIRIVSQTGTAAKQALPKEERYARTPSGVTIADVTIRNPGRTGVFVDNYVRGTHLVRVRVESAADSGIYLEQSSTGTVIEDSALVGNGFGELLRPKISVWKREGIAIDSSADNVIRRTLFSGNAGGGIFLYKNCHEHAASNPNSVPRWMPSARNEISDNRFENEPIGVWVASRQSRLLFDMQCGDPQYAPGLFLDAAPDNRIRGNQFSGGDIAIRVEDDGTQIVDNRMVRPGTACVKVGTTPRSVILNRPVIGTILTGNRCEGAPAGGAFVFTDGSRPASASGNLPPNGITAR